MARYIKQWRVILSNGALLSSVINVALKSGVKSNIVSASGSTTMARNGRRNIYRHITSPKALK
jgi:hypothetical protein